MPLDKLQEYENKVSAIKTTGLDDQQFSEVAEGMEELQQATARHMGQDIFDSMHLPSTSGVGTPAQQSASSASSGEKELSMSKLRHKLKLDSCALDVAKKALRKVVDKALAVNSKDVTLQKTTNTTQTNN